MTKSAIQSCAHKITLKRHPIFLKEWSFTRKSPRSKLFFPLKGRISHLAQSETEGKHSPKQESPTNFAACPNKENTQELCVQTNESRALHMWKLTVDPSTLKNNPKRHLICSEDSYFTITQLLRSIQEHIFFTTEMHNVHTRNVHSKPFHTSHFPPKHYIKLPDLRYLFDWIARSANPNCANSEHWWYYSIPVGDSANQHEWYV